MALVSWLQHVRTWVTGESRAVIWILIPVIRERVLNAALVSWMKYTNTLEPGLLKLVD